jgi:peptidoglycan-associated lipoprotein
MKTSISFCLIFSLTFLFSCSSKKVEKKSSSNDVVSKDGLVLNGDSDSGKAGKLKTVYFSYNSSQLDNKAKDILKNNAEFLKQNTNVFLEIEGHCDERGGRQYNLALGERRAKMVRDYLNALGVKSFRLKVISYGNERPLSDAPNEQAWSKNRRSNFVVIGL